LEEWPGIIESFIDEVVMWERLEGFVGNFDGREEGIANSLLETKSDFRSQTLPEWRGFEGKGFEEG
jgi:hypothetical protein